MYREKSTARREHLIVASSSSSDDDNNVSLGADQEETPALTHNTASSSVVLQCKGSVPSQRDPFTASTRRIGRTTFQCKSVLL